MALHDYINKIETVLGEQYIDSLNHEDPYKTVSKQFGGLFKQAIKSQLKHNEVEIVDFSCGYCYVSGFISDGNNLVYFATPDFRFSPNEWKSNILIRTAESTKDFTGGRNHFVSLLKFGSQVRELLKGGANRG